MDENMKAFLNYGTKGGMETEDPPTSTFLAALLGLPGCFIPRTPKILIVCIVAFILSILIVETYCDKNSSKKGIVFLCRGNTSLSYSIIFLLEAICIMLYIIPEGKKLCTTVLIFLIYVIVIISYVYLIKHLIKKGAFNKNGKVGSPVVIYISSAMGLCGLSTGKLLLKKSGNALVFMIMMICLFLLSLIFMIGVMNLIRYYYVQIYGKKNS